METFIIGYLIGCTSTIAVWVFLNAKGKGNSTESLEGRIDRNNTDTRSSIARSEDRLDEARAVNTGIGNINKTAIDRIEDSERTVSGIIATAERKRRYTDKE